MKIITIRTIEAIHGMGKPKPPQTHPLRCSARQADDVLDGKGRAGVHPVFHHKRQWPVAPAHGQAKCANLLEGELRTNDGRWLQQLVGLDAACSGGTSTSCTRIIGPNGTLRGVGHHGVGLSARHCSWEWPKAYPARRKPRTAKPATGSPCRTGGKPEQQHHPATSGMLATTCRHRSLHRRQPAFHHKADMSTCALAAQCMHRHSQADLRRCPQVCAGFLFSLLSLDWRVAAPLRRSTRFFWPPFGGLLLRHPWPPAPQPCANSIQRVPAVSAGSWMVRVWPFSPGKPANSASIMTGIRGAMDAAVLLVTSVDS